MTDAEPTRVFARFPWPQLIFCVACLSMAGWTWMRYSYCWRMTSEEALGFVDRINELRWPAGAYVELDVAPMRKIPLLQPKRGITFIGFFQEPYVLVRRGRLSPYIQGTFWIQVELPADEFITFEVASRFHGASIAGLVVGAMGCFIFGLYLRRWLRERDSAA